jgi:hypothetical protein
MTHKIDDRRYVVALNPWRRMVVGESMPEQIEDTCIVKTMSYNDAVARAGTYQNAVVCELVEVEVTA